MQIESVQGVVAHGLVVGVAKLALVAGEEGPAVFEKGDAAKFIGAQDGQ